MTRTYDLTPFHRSAIGFDRLFDDLLSSNLARNTESYPPYNILKLNDDEYVISLAVAGFGMDMLEITKDRNELRVSGVQPESDDERVYLHKGIATRPFNRQFTVADYVEVVDAKLENGMLNIHLKREVPEELQPKKIAITSVE